jgi:hypothetical protein
MFNMPRSKQRLAQLSRVLGGLPQDTLPMTVTEFDGFVTGILITPVHVTPSEYRMFGVRRAMHSFRINALLRQRLMPCSRILMLLHQNWPQ